MESEGGLGDPRTLQLVSEVRALVDCFLTSQKPILKYKGKVNLGLLGSLLFSRKKHRGFAVNFFACELLLTVKITNGFPVKCYWYRLPRSFGRSILRSHLDLARRKRDAIN